MKREIGTKKKIKLVLVIIVALIISAVTIYIHSALTICRIFGLALIMVE